MWSKDLFSSISTTTWLIEDRPVPLLIPAPFAMADPERQPDIPAVAHPMVAPRTPIVVAIPVASGRTELARECGQDG